MFARLIAGLAAKGLLAGSMTKASRLGFGLRSFAEKEKVAEEAKATAAETHGAKCIPPP